MVQAEISPHVLLKRPSTVANVGVGRNGRNAKRQCEQQRVRREMLADDCDSPSRPLRIRELLYRPMTTS
jgi:hypothetical protein